jgi:hypothetical protein
MLPRGFSGLNRLFAKNNSNPAIPGGVLFLISMPAAIIKFLIYLSPN